jgi:diadenylate cyclase
MEGFGSFLYGIRWQDIVDILLNSYIIFRLYALFKGTTTFRVLLGIVFLWFFQRTAFALGLVITSWAIQGILAAGALIVIIVFRNEIRSVFQAANLKSIFWGTPGKVMGTPVDIIVDSVFALARRKIGALIVIPGNDNIDEFLQNGIQWQGTLSKEMLISIFWPDNPVHDGAAIIRGNRVLKVGVILPLTERNDLPSYFGTRHRAAGGMAERSDAFVLLVSEERGEVVFAQNDRIRGVRDPEFLKKVLFSHLGMPALKKEEEKYQRRDMIFAAALSVLFITGVWFSITRGSDILTAMEVPVEYVKSDAETEIVETSVNNVRLHLSGSSFLIKSIRPEQVRVRLNIKDNNMGKTIMPIHLEDVSLPPGIMLNRIEPPEVEVTLAKPTMKNLPVQVDWDGRLPDDLILSEVRVTPKSVNVTGKSNVLKNLSTVYTEKLLLDDIRESGKTRVKLVLENITLSPEEKNVLIEFAVTRRTKE